MVVIPAGRFRMGCLSNHSICDDSEKPVHEVVIPRSFALSVHEVTVEDYDRFRYSDDSYEADDEGWGRRQRPVTNVSWNDAKEYVAWLSKETGEEYRLPSESEWEYAARAGSATQYSWGNEIDVNRANCWDWENLGTCGDRWEQTAPVGSFTPNAWGLHDMHGNVWEWMEDGWNASYVGAPSDGSAWLGGDSRERVLRGGSWGSDPDSLRTSSRYWSHPNYDSAHVGFRVARSDIGFAWPK